MTPTSIYVVSGIILLALTTIAVLAGRRLIGRDA